MVAGSSPQNGKFLFQIIINNKSSSFHFIPDNTNYFVIITQQVTIPHTEQIENGHNWKMELMSQKITKLRK